MFLVRAVEVNTLPEERYGDSPVAVDRTPNPAIERRTSHRRPNEMFVATA